MIEFRNPYHIEPPGVSRQILSHPTNETEAITTRNLRSVTFYYYYVSEIQEFFITGLRTSWANDASGQNINAVVDIGDTEIFSIPDFEKQTQVITLDANEKFFGFSGTYRDFFTTSMSLLVHDPACSGDLSDPSAFNVTPTYSTTNVEQVATNSTYEDDNDDIWKLLFILVSCLGALLIVACIFWACAMSKKVLSTNTKV